MFTLQQPLFATLLAYYVAAFLLTLIPYVVARAVYVCGNAFWLGMKDARQPVAFSARPSRHDDNPYRPPDDPQPFIDQPTLRIWTSTDLRRVALVAIVVMALLVLITP